MYNPKFKYTTINRVNVSGKRHYETPNGKLPSVTTILDATKPEEEKKALFEWKKRVGEAKANQISTEAANRGTKMHTYLERYIKDGVQPSKSTNFMHHDSWHMADEVIQKGLKNCQEFWGVEVPLYYPELYAGTTDCIGVHKNIPSIIDFKQSNKPKKREWIDGYFLQLVFYANAHNEVHGTDIKQGVIMMCVKPEKTVLPIYQEFILEGDEWKRFNRLMWDRLEQYFSLVQARQII
jgi:hypothetical protein